MSDLWIIDEQPSKKPGHTRAFDGTLVPSVLDRMNCGGLPVFDRESGMSYRCDKCWAVIGSVGQPQSCKDMNE